MCGLQTKLSKHTSYETAATASSCVGETKWPTDYCSAASR